MVCLPIDESYTSLAAKIGTTNANANANQSMVNSEKSVISTRNIWVLC